MHSYRYYYLPLLLILTTLSGKAQSIAILTDTSSNTKTIKGVIPAPVVYYTPNTGFAIGANILGYLKLKSKTDTTYTRLSVARLFADYTWNKQTYQWLSWNIFTRDEKFLLRGELRNRIYRDRFYGIGNVSQDEDEEIFWYNYVSARIAGLKSLGRHVFFGPDFQIENYYNIKLDSLDAQRDSQLRANQIPGYKGGINSGLGAIFLIDARNNVAFPSKGYYLELSAYHFGSTFGGDFDYNNYNFIFSSYYELKPDHVLGTNTVLNLNSGNVPVQRLATSGGERILRSYARNRFFDDHFAGTQAEYRFPLFRKVGMVAFAGVGDVFDKPSDISLSTLKYSIGTGFRYSVLPQEKLNSRLDIGLGREGIAVFVGIGEAF
ncbi:BamA/TamA family outer membrane protein [Pontibacter silvestris]|uniref:BamA/TamA family outer membrane protein n=1 Tax=Pontibacter silvestris TaxID=2305183 RepID=A0ABW4WZY7_9BACT|nr:BamA/TamA family outer membrane protein [Pontibacter silvestris]MCC9135433.1 outer membrane protein assembly factor [Pontibacter silvestris]